MSPYTQVSSRPSGAEYWTSASRNGEGKRCVKSNSAARAVRRVDHAIEQRRRARVLGGRQKLPVAHAAQLPVPFAMALDAQPQFVELLCAREARIGRHRRDVLRGGGERARRQHDRDAEFLGSKLAVEVELRRDLRKVILGLGRPALGLQCAPVPVDPGRIARAGRRGMRSIVALHGSTSRRRAAPRGPATRALRRYGPRPARRRRARRRAGTSRWPRGRAAGPPCDQCGPRRRHAAPASDAG